MSTEAAEPYIRIENVTKTFGGFVAIEDVSLTIERGELFSLLGGSGCGKTTLLRMLAGFEMPTRGRILIDGIDVAGIPPYQRPVNMMFQSYALFPHMTVESNIGFGLRQEGIAKAEIKERVSAMLDLVQLGRFGGRKPHQLSGGQRQRVALARALIKQPKLLLLDEPLAALDKKLREQTQFELVNIQERVGITFIVVTHDQSEAMTLSSRMAVMNEGRIVQVGTPSEIYEYPGSRFVADFIGSVNMIEGRVLRIEGENAVIEAEATGGELLAETREGLAAGDPVALAVRPEKLTIGKDTPPHDENALRGVIEEIAYQGDISIYQVRLPSGTIMRVTAPNRERSALRALTWEDEVTLSWRPDASVLLTS